MECQEGFCEWLTCLSWIFSVWTFLLAKSPRCLCHRRGREVQLQLVGVSGCKPPKGAFPRKVLKKGDPPPQHARKFAQICFFSIMLKLTTFCQQLYFALGVVGLILVEGSEVRCLEWRWTCAVACRCWDFFLCFVSCGWIYPNYKDLIGGPVTPKR